MMRNERMYDEDDDTRSICWISFEQHFSLTNKRGKI